MSSKERSSSLRLWLTVLLASCMVSAGLLLNKSGNDGMVKWDGEYDYEPYVFTKWDLGFVDSKSNAVIRLGMTKRQVEAAAGEPLGEASWLLKEHHIDHLTIKLRGGKVVGLAMTVENSRFHTARDVGVSTSAEELVQKYGDSEYGQYSLLYEDGEYRLREDSTTVAKPYERDRSYYLSFAMKDGKVSAIHIGDDRFMRTPR